VIVDSSALVAMARDEAGSERLRRKVDFADRPAKMASANFLETAIVIDGRRDPLVRRKLDDLIEELEIEIIPFTAEHARMARDAYRDYGKGSGHPAKLNFGDAMAYAVARSEREPLLYVGDDFVHTDIDAA
jgi:ribonuclease VapC